MTTVQTIWMEVHTAAGFKEGFNYRPPGKPPYDEQDIINARKGALEYAARYPKTTIREHLTSDSLAIAIFVDTPARGDWQPRTPPPLKPRSGPPPWEADKAAALIGKRILVRLNERPAGAGADTPPRVTEFYGRVTKCDQQAGIHVACEGSSAGQTRTLPPALWGLTPGKPGTYRLNTTGEEVTDVDYTAAWDVSDPKPAPERS